METRYTSKPDGIDEYLVVLNPNGETGEVKLINHFQKLIDRLGAYEDTGLDPWEIRRLKEQDEMDRKTLLNFDCLGVEDLATRYCLAKSERDSLKAERDAAVRDIVEAMEADLSICVLTHQCWFCAFYNSDDCPLEKDGECAPKWRGPQQEET